MLDRKFGNAVDECTHILRTDKKNVKVCPSALGSQLSAAQLNPFAIPLVSFPRR